jgi:adhesin
MVLTLLSIDSSTLLAGKTGGITVNQDKKAGETDAGKATVNNNDATKLATVKNVADAINGAKWFAKVENLSDSMNVRTKNDNDTDAQAMGAGDILTLKADKNLAVKREGKDVTYGLASEIEVDKITVKSKTPGAATTTFENGKITNLDNHLENPVEAAVDKSAVPNAKEVKTPIGLTNDKKKEAATVNDVLNAGWNLKASGKQVAAVTNGKSLDFSSDDNSVTITPTVDKDGNAKVNFSVNATSVINNTKGTISEATTEDPKADKAGQVTVTGTPQPKANGSMETQDEANAREGNKVATVQNVVNAINSAATFVKVADSQEVITASTADDNGVAVKSGDTVTHTAGKNLKVKRDGKSVTYALAQDIDVNSVKAINGVTIGSGDNATTITSNDKGLNLAGKDGAETNINNVKDADLNSTSKQAVNGSQLYTTNVQVNKNSQNINRIESKVDSLSRVINNHADELNRLDRKVNKQGKEARAGIAGANAAAALPQVYTAGKSMVAASAGTFKGQNAVAVGYSRASDNGKVILKLQGNANTSGDVGAGVGVGYQW